MDRSREAGDEAQAARPEPLADAMEALALALREFGRGAPDAGDVSAGTVRATCDRWARHVLLGDAPPGEPAVAGPPAPIPPAGRRWRAAAQYLAGRRHVEARRMAHAQLAMQQELQGCLRALDSLAAGDAASGERLGQLMERLRAVASAMDPALLGREVVAAAGELARLSRERRAEVRAQLAEIQGRVRRVAGERDAACADGMMDELTRLFSRAAFDEHARRTVAQARLLGRPTSMLMIDVDRFEQFNQARGRAAGDEVLRELGARLTRVLRVRSDFVARYGGGQFAAILGETDGAQAVRAAERLLEAVRAEPVAAAHGRLAVTVSAGVAVLRDGEPVAVWLGRAGRALHDAKEAGRDRVAAAP